MTAGSLLCRIDEIPDGAARGFAFGDGAARREIPVVRQADRVYAYVNACRHAGTPLDWVPDRFMSPMAATCNAQPTAPASASMTGPASKAPAGAGRSRHSP